MNSNKSIEFNDRIVEKLEYEVSQLRKRDMANKEIIQEMQKRFKVKLSLI
jgi:hypothetical protein